MPAYYDDNFGFYDMDDDPEEALAFYRANQRKSVEKVCVDCGRTVRLLPQYECCDSCADRRERGWGY